MLLRQFFYPRGQRNAHCRAICREWSVRGSAKGKTLRKEISTAQSFKQGRPLCATALSSPPSFPVWTLPACPRHASGSPG